MVIDKSNKNSLTGAVVSNECNGKNTITNERGQFTLDITGPQCTILVRHLGYKPARYTITDPSIRITIELEASNILLGEVIVSAYESNRKIQQIPGNVTLISRENLQTEQDVSIVPALNRIPGIYVHSGTFNTNRLTIRGIGSRSLYATQKIRAYFNEIPLTSGNGETTVEDIDPNLIDRIEIIKGPSSSLYGAGLGGTLLIKSNKPLRKDKNLTFHTVAGSYGHIKNAIDFNYSADKTNLTLSGNRIHDDGYRENNDYDRYSFGFMGDIYPGERTTLTFLTNYIDLLASIPSSIDRETYENSPGSAAQNWKYVQGYEDYFKWLTGIGIHHTINASSSFHISIFGNYRKSYERRPFNILTEKTRAAGLRAKYSISSHVWDIPTVIIAGTELFNDLYSWQTWIIEDLQQGDLITDNLEDRSNLNFFTKVDLQVSKKSFITTGLNVNSTHYDYTDEYSTDGQDESGNYSFGTTISPRVGYSFNIIKNLNLHASISHGFSPPTLQETLTPEGNINPDIRPEKGTNYEAGIKGTLFNNRLYTDMSVYTLRIKDLLVARRTGEDKFTGINAGQTLHNGIELYGSFSFLNPALSEKEMNGFLAYSLNKYKFKEFVDADNDFSGNELTGVPGQTFNAGFMFKWLDFYGNLTYQFVDKMPMRDDNSVYSDLYHLVNSKLGYKKAIFEALEIDIFININNIFNEKYASQIMVNASNFNGGLPRYYYPGLPRNFYLGCRIKYRFGK